MRLRAITLIETLTCLAIIAIIAGILYPVMGSAKRSAMERQSISDMKQIAMAAMVYREGWKTTDLGDMVAMGLPEDYRQLFNPKGRAVKTGYPIPPIHPAEFAGYYYMPVAKEIDGRNPTWVDAVNVTKESTVLVCNPWFDGYEGRTPAIWNAGLPHRIHGVSLEGSLLTKKAYGIWFDFSRWR